MSKPIPWLLTYLQHEFQGISIHVADDSDSDSDSDLTHESDSDGEPSSASDPDEEDPMNPVNMGSGHIIRHPTNTYFTRDGHVQELNDETFSSIVDHAFVMFYMEGCPHCTEMKPVYQRVMNHVCENGTHHAYAISSAHKQLCKTYHVDGFPTVLHMSLKKATSEFQHGPDRSLLLDWVTSCTNNKSMEGTSPSSFFRGKVKEVSPTELEALPNSSVVMFFAPWCGYCKEAKPIYEQVANTVSSPLYAINCDTYHNVAKDYGVEGFPTFCKLKGNKMIERYNGEREVKPMISWVNGTTRAIDVDDNHPLPKTKCIVMFYAPWCGHCKTAKPEFDAFSMLSNIPCYKVNCDEQIALRDKYSIQAYPTFLMIDEEKQIGQYKGPRNVNGFLSWGSEN